MPAKSVVRSALATGPGRLIHGAYLSAVHTRRRRRLVRVTFRQDGWLLRYSSAVLPAGVHKTPEQLDAETLDYFCWDYRPRSGDTVLDVGAGVGTEVLTFSRQVGPSGRVYAMEAHPDEFARLQQLVEANGLSNVVAVNVALGDQVGTTRISTVAANIDSHSIVNAATFDVDDRVIRATTLDEFVTQRGIERIDLLKMNIEGAERLVIMAADRAIARTEHVAISCHDFVADGGRGGDEMRTRADVLSYLHDHGFEARWRADDARAFVRGYLYGSKAPARVKTAEQRSREAT